MINPKEVENLELRELSFGYENSLLFERVSFTLPRGRVVHVRSQTGAGKSALLKLFAGLLQPTAGEYLINGQSVTDMSFEEFLPFRLAFGYSFDLGGLLNNRTLRENIMLPLEYHKRFSASQIKEHCEEVINSFRLEAVADRRPASVSGSQRKACVVARSIVTNPQVLLLDDPTTGLGEKEIAHLEKYITKQLKIGSLRFALVATGDLAFARRLSAEELEIRDGSVRWERVAAA